MFKYVRIILEKNEAGADNKRDNMIVPLSLLCLVRRENITSKDYVSDDYFYSAGVPNLMEPISKKEYERLMELYVRDEMV